MRLNWLLAVIVGGCWLGGDALAAQTGRIEGQLRRPDGGKLGGVQVSLDTGATTLSNANGQFALADVAVGTHAVTLAIADLSEVVSGVDVAANATTRLDRTLDWQVAFGDTITVVSASRQNERITEAPAAVTVITSEEIGREASHGQLPKLLEFTPGAEVTQSGVYDYNLNTRGFNSSLNRRVATIIDGREPGVPFLGAQEWAAVTFPLDDLAQAELVRGPSAALYGANASSGVLNMVTKRPKDSPGGLVRISGGELETKNADLRLAGGIGGPFYGKLLGGIRRSGDYTVSRVGAAEYSRPCTATITADCLPQERAPLDPLSDDEISFASARIDGYAKDGGLLTVEGGWADITGPVFQTGIGRVQLVDVTRRYTRIDYSREHWDVLASYNGRQADRQTALSTGNNLTLDEQNWKGEIQTYWGLFDDRARVIGGVSYKDEKVDSTDENGPLRPSLFNPGNQQTLLFEGVRADSQAAYGQVDWNANDRLKLVVALRYDESSLHTPEWSPKAALVFAVTPNHSFRLTYNEAFQVPNYSEFFLQADVAAPINLAPFEGFCALYGVACGFDIDFSPGEDLRQDRTPDTRILAVGNASLKPEEVKTIELGYTGILGAHAFLTVDAYYSRNENFVTDLLPQLGTALGRINPNFAAYQTPQCNINGSFRSCLPDAAEAALLAQLRAALGPRFALLTNNLDGTPFIAAASYTNFGAVDTTGVDVGLELQLPHHFGASLTGSWFDYDIRDSRPGLDRLLLPNSPEFKASGAVRWIGTRADVELSYRWVDSFRWVVGPFQGDVPSYGTADLAANLHLGEHWTLGAHVANLTDEEHWESFGGDILARRALGTLTFAW
jgi:iron complex outermembrane receptor protein